MRPTSPLLAAPLPALLPPLLLLLLLALAAAPRAAAVWPARQQQPAERAPGYLVVYRADATAAQIAAARARIAAAPGGAKLSRTVAFGAGTGGSSSGSGGGGVGAAALPSGPLRIDVVDAPRAGAVGASGSGGGVMLAALSALPGVAYVVRDGIATVQRPARRRRLQQQQPQQQPQPKQGQPAAEVAAPAGVAVQHNPPNWGLDRINQRHLPLDHTYSYANTSGAGSVVYIIDTGVDTAHPEFEGRAEFGADFTGEGPGDGYGHGTHTAGTAGGRTVGVAKAATLVAVKVLDKRGRGSWSQVIDGLQWAVADCAAGTRAGGGRMCVASMSLGGELNQAVNDAVAATVKAGLVVVVAAGNAHKDACKGSPAAAPAALTVGATTKRDARASFSNWGPCVDVYAPGVSIKSSVPLAQCGGRACYAAWSGTSMSTPHVSGIAALLWPQLAPGAGPQDVAAAIVNIATGGAVKQTARDGSPPLLAFNGSPLR